MKDARLTFCDALQLPDLTISADTQIGNEIGVDATKDWAKGGEVPIHLEVAELFESGGAATLTLLLWTDDEVTFASPTVVWSSGALALATLVTGYTFVIRSFPLGNRGYYSLAYTVITADFTASTSPTACRLSGYIPMGRRQENP